VWQATENSLRAAVDATVLAVLVGGLVALVSPVGRGSARRAPGGCRCSMARSCFR